uniref:Transmembrane protein n=1 Tax=Caenorhabditis japonica TaxID=281687 RepID=A0A8R1IAA6_CAEJA
MTATLETEEMAKMANTNTDIKYHRFHGILHKDSSILKMNVYSVFVFAIFAISSVSSIGVIKGGKGRCNNGYGGGNIIIGAEKPQK